MRSYVITYIAIMAIEIIFGFIAIKYLLWWDGVFVILGILCGLGIWAGSEIKTRKQEKK